nr:hypothetical protein [uncultured Acetatifactor sp.]
MLFMNVAAKYYPYVIASGGSTSGNTSMSNVLSMASELMSWVITQMAAILTFITGNTLILVFFIMTICGFAVGFLMRIWRSVG